MKIGIGIPNSIPGAGGGLLLDWAHRAESLGFVSLATIGRVAYPSAEELVVLAAAAGATERIGLFTNVLLGPTREPALLAKQAATLDQLSGGRFLLGVGVGGRPDDFETTGTGLHDRGRRWDRALDLMHRAWRGEPVDGSPKPISPRPANGDRVPLMMGGGSDAAIRRTVEWGVGWTAGGGGVDLARGMFEKVRAAWERAGKPGRPELRALTYFALGPDADRGGDYLQDYYGELGAQIWPRVPRNLEAVRATRAAFEEIGTDVLTFSPTIASLDQVDLLAEAVLEPA